MNNFNIKCHFNFVSCHYDTAHLRVAWCGEGLHGCAEGLERAVANTLMNVHVPEKLGELLPSLAIISFSELLCTMDLANITYLKWTCAYVVS
jgi:hypothetical protein